MTKSTALMGPTSESFPTRCSVKCDPCLPLHSSWPPSLTLTSSRLPLALYPAWRAPSDHESSLAKTRIPAVGGSASLRATTPPPLSTRWFLPGSSFGHVEKRGCGTHIPRGRFWHVQRVTERASPGPHSHPTSSSSSSLFLSADRDLISNGEEKGYFWK